MIELEVEARIRLKTSQEYKELKEEKDMFKRRMLFLAFFTEKLKENGVDAILVGGEAIDLYTAGTFASADLDLVVNNKAMTEKFLNRFGFGKKDAIWFNTDLNIVVQVIPGPYSGNPSKIRKFKIRKYELKVAAPEDLIANRLYSAKFWKSNIQTDIEQSVTLLRQFSDSIDNAYLDSIAKRDNIEDALAEARQLASNV